MRIGTQWRHLQQLGRAFTASPFPSGSNEANLINSTFASWSKPVEQLWKSCTTLAQGINQEKNPTLENLHSSFRRGHVRHFSISGLEFGTQPNVSTSNFGHRQLYSVNPNHWKLRFGLTPVRSQGSIAHSREPEHWDTSLRFNQEGLPTDQNRPQREREWDHDEDEDLTRDRKVRKDTHNMKMSRDVDEIGWGHQHVRLREYENRQRASLSPDPPPEFQQDDVYIPVKACYISRNVDLKRLSEAFLDVTTSRNNLIIRFANRPTDAEPTSNRPVQFSILYLLTSLALCFVAAP